MTPYIKYIFFYKLLTVLLFCACHPKKITINTASHNSIVTYGGFPNDKQDDTAAFQAALDDGHLILEKGEYIVTKPLVIKKNMTNIEGNGLAIINYNASGSLFSINRVNNNYPVNCSFKNICIILNKENSTGIECKLSYSYFEMIRIQLKKSNSIGLSLVGDTNGTGPYYNSFHQVTIQGNIIKGSGVKNQAGIKFVAAPNNRSPNANTFVGGRIGQVNIGIEINGGGNNFYSPTLEGITDKCFYFNHSSSKVGCVSNNIYSPYIEGAAGVTVADFGKNSINNQVLNPYITSIGLKGKTIMDNSTQKNNGVIMAREISKKYSEGGN